MMCPQTAQHGSIAFAGSMPPQMRLPRMPAARARFGRTAPSVAHIAAASSMAFTPWASTSAATSALLMVCAYDLAACRMPQAVRWPPWMK
jgi:hypothetical protein